jgi:hypothetical protein
VLFQSKTTSSSRRGRGKKETPPLKKKGKRRKGKGKEGKGRIFTGWLSYKLSKWDPRGVNFPTCLIILL